MYNVFTLVTFVSFTGNGFEDKDAEPFKQLLDVSFISNPSNQI